jgi:hypothetical protein
MRGNVVQLAGEEGDDEEAKRAAVLDAAYLVSAAAVCQVAMGASHWQSRVGPSLVRVRRCQGGGEASGWALDPRPERLTGADRRARRRGAGWRGRSGDRRRALQRGQAGGIIGAARVVCERGQGASDGGITVRSPDTHSPLAASSDVNPLGPCSDRRRPTSMRGESLRKSQG